MTVRPGDMLVKDPSAVLVYIFDWTDWLNGALISTSAFTISGSDSALTKDQESIVTGALKTRVRLSSGTLGVRYTLMNRITTNETPAQTDDRTVTILISQQ